MPDMVVNPHGANDLKTDRIRVYVAGPYSGDTEANTETAIATGQWLLEDGFAPMVPHLTHFWEERFHNTWETWLELDLPWVAQADCVFRMPGHSKGADIEVGFAKALGIPVYHDEQELIDHPPVRGDSRFHTKLREIGALHDAKQRDYGHGKDPFANVRASSDWGIAPWVGALVRLNDKVKRLQTFARTHHLTNEGAQDSLLDIAVYALIASVLLDEQEEERKHE